MNFFISWILCENVDHCVGFGNPLQFINATIIYAFVGRDGLQSQASDDAAI